MHKISAKITTILEIHPINARPDPAAIDAIIGAKIDVPQLGHPNPREIITAENDEFERDLKSVFLTSDLEIINSEIETDCKIRTIINKNPNKKRAFSNKIIGSSKKVINFEVIAIDEEKMFKLKSKF